jgi:nucleotide-binding universal stress UspA family protein
VSVLIIGDATKLPGQPGADVAVWLARHGLDVEITTMPGTEIPVAASILNHATDNGFDLVVIGAYGHSWVREALLGGATRDILKTMTVPVLMAH